MITGLKKKQKTTEIYFNEADDITTISTYNTKLKNRLLDFSNSPRDIADPWYTGNFDKTYDDILEGCNAFLNCILK